MRHRFLTADVFTDRIFGGNPLAVFPDARGIADDRMQRVARELNLSETVFVLPPEDPAHTRCLRIFTPASEVPFAGHPTVGTAFVLASIGEIPLEGDRTNIVFEEGVGPVPVTIRSEGGRPAFSQLSVAQLPERGPKPPATAELAAMLSLDADDLLQGEERAETWSCGVPFLYLPLRSREAVARARVDLPHLERHLGGFWADMVFVFCREDAGGEADIHARMFAPTMGIPEDPATGAAAAAFAGYLGARHETREGTCRWRIEQGVEMGRPSLIEVEADKVDGTIAAVRVGGGSVLVSEGEMEIP